MPTSELCNRAHAGAFEGRKTYAFIARDTKLKTGASQLDQLRYVVAAEVTNSTVV